MTAEVAFPHGSMAEALIIYVLGLPWGRFASKPPNSVTLGASRAPALSGGAFRYCPPCASMLLAQPRCQSPPQQQSDPTRPGQIKKCDADFTSLWLSLLLSIIAQRCLSL